MANPTLRTAKPADLGAVEALVHAAYAPWVEVIGATPKPMLDDYARAIAQGRVSVQDGPQGIAAILMLVAQPDAMLLENIAVAPWAQGQGIARQLIQLAEDRARAAGLPRMRLYTHAKMASNITLYQRAGYVIVGEGTEFGLTRVYMEKPVSDPAP